MNDKLVLDRQSGRHPHAVRRAGARTPSGPPRRGSRRRRPYDLDSTGPPIGAGAPGPQCPPDAEGGDTDGTATVGHKLTVERGGTWTRPGAARHGRQRSRYLWLRDGAPHPQYNGAPIGSKPECECDAPSTNTVRDPAARTPGTGSAPGHRARTRRTRRPASSRMRSSVQGTPTRRSSRTCWRSRSRSPAWASTGARPAS